MILDDLRETKYRDYTAVMQRNLVNMLGRYLYADWQPVPSWLEIAHPKTEPEPRQESVEESKAHVYQIFGITPPERG